MPWLFLCNTNFMHPAGVLGPEETTCTTRMPWSYAYGEITGMIANERLAEKPETFTR